MTLHFAKKNLVSTRKKLNKESRKEFKEALELNRLGEKTNLL